MRVVADRQSEMPARIFAGPLDDVFAAADQLNDRERKIGKMIGVGRLPLFEKCGQRGLIGR